MIFGAIVNWDQYNKRLFQKFVRLVYHFSEKNSDFGQWFHASYSPGQVVAVSVQAFRWAVDGGDLRFAWKQNFMLNELIIQVQSGVAQWLALLLRKNLFGGFF